MSKVLTPQKAVLAPSKKPHSKDATPTAGDIAASTNAVAVACVDFDDFTSSSSILEFLSREQECCSDADAESIFQEVSRLADNSDTRSVDEILREAELLIQQQVLLNDGQRRGGKSASNREVTKPKQIIKMNEKYTKRIENVPQPPPPPQEVPLMNGLCGDSPRTALPTPQSPEMRTNSLVGDGDEGGKPFEAFVENLPSVSVLSEESTPKDLQNFTFRTDQDDDATTAQLLEDDTDGTDTMEEITEGIETLELLVSEGPCPRDGNAPNTVPIAASALTRSTPAPGAKFDYMTRRRPSGSGGGGDSTPQSHHMSSPTRRQPLNFNATQACSPSPQLERSNSGGGTRRSSLTMTPDSGFSLSHNTTAVAVAVTTSCHYAPRPYSPSKPAMAAGVGSPAKTFRHKAVNSSPKRMVSTLTSPIEASMAGITREHTLKQEIERLQERLKDTEERLQSLRIQHDSLSQLHRDLRESNTHLQDESETLKLDVQHLNECANILRSELKAARNDRDEALELQRTLQAELEDGRQERKRAYEQKDGDARVIQDLQRQCREMERILMRKHPDSVSALIVASKSSGKGSSSDQENASSRKLLEGRIAQLESDAKEQDLKAQQILANVQARFNAVQSKYETHIADLETQVLSLQEINTKLNEKIESQVRTLDYFVAKKADKYYNNCTQTDPVASPPPASVDGGRPHSTAATQTAGKGATATRDHSTNTIGTVSQQHSASSSTSSTANSTPNTSRPNSKQSGLRRPLAGSLTSVVASKLPISQSDSTISSYHHVAAKEEAHLLATIRGMRVDLAIKDKAMQRLTRELDECKKTIKKLQREKDVALKTGANSTACSTSRRTYEAAHHGGDLASPASTESQALKEAQNKIKLLEADYKSLHDKRLQDLKTLQTAHERELASCHDTVRILQQRLSEREEAAATQKRRKLPVDYYALKAKVSSLERRHSEREERLHMLVEALSKGRLNGALEDLLSDNNNQ